MGRTSGWLRLRMEGLPYARLLKFSYPSAIPRELQ